MKLRILSVLTLTCILTSCALLQGRRPPTAQSAEPLEQPYEPRTDGEAPLRKRVMVLPFLDAEAGHSVVAAKIARDSLIRSLSQGDAFVVVGAGDFPKNPSQYVKNGQYDLKEMAKVADPLGLAALLEGKLVEIRARRIGDSIGLVREIRVRMEATVQIRIVSAKNGQILLDDTRTAEIEDVTTRLAERSTSDRVLEDDPKLIEAVVRKAFLTSTPKITQALEKLSWEGRVALIKADRIYLNAGRLSGLQIGDILKVMEEGEDVFDPETGALIGRVPGRLKGTLEVVSYFGKDGAISIVHSGSGFRENDIVELY